MGYFQPQETSNFTQFEPPLDEQESALQTAPGRLPSPSNDSDSDTYHRVMIFVPAGEQPLIAEAQPQPATDYGGVSQNHSLSEIQFTFGMKPEETYSQGDTAVQTALEAEQPSLQPNGMSPPASNAFYDLNQQSPSMPAAQTKEKPFEQQKPDFGVQFEANNHGAYSLNRAGEQKHEVRDAKLPHRQATHDKKKNNGANYSGVKQRKRADNRRIFGVCSTASAQIYSYLRNHGPFVPTMPILSQTQYRLVHGPDNHVDVLQTPILGYPTAVHKYYGTVRQGCHHGNNENA